MKTIFCENQYGQDATRCGRWLARLSEAQLEALKQDPEGHCDFRCPACPAVVRWKSIRYENGKYIFSVIDKPEMDTAMEYDEVEIAVTR